MRHAGERDRRAPALLRLYGAEIVDSPGEEGSNGAVAVAERAGGRDPRYMMLFQYANPANPRAHYEGTGAEIVRDCPASTCSSRDSGPAAR